MDDKELEDILNTIKISCNKRQVYENLTSIRQLVINDDQFTKFVQYGGVRIIAGLLSKNNFNIVDISLSILGNCCYKRKISAKEVIRYHGLKLLRNILVNWKQDSILCRALRLLGNIAEFDEYGSHFSNYNFVQVIVKILNESTSVSQNEENKDCNEISMGTQDMAIRVLRILCNYASNRQCIVSEGGVRAVSIVMIKYTNLWQMESNHCARKQQEKFLQNVLKCLIKMAVIIKNKEVISEICVDGDGSKCLVSLIDLDPVVPIHCLVALSRYAVSRSILQNAAAVTKILQKIQDNQFNSTCDESYSEKLLAALRLLSQHPMNRHELIENNGLKIMLETLHSCTSLQYRHEILIALNNFHRHENSHLILVENGIVKIMMKLLNEYLQYPCPKKSDELRMFNKRLYKEIVYNIMNQKRTKAGMSPSSSYSPVSSPSCTPPHNHEKVEDDTDSDDYSPVCSDNEDLESVEDTDPPETLGTEDVEESIPKNDNINSNLLLKQTIVMLINELSHVVHMKNTALDFTSYSTIKTLVSHPLHPLFGKMAILLYSILGNVENLIPLIKNNVVCLLRGKEKVRSNELNVLSKTANSQTGLSLIVDEMKQNNNSLHFWTSIPLLLKKRYLPKLFSKTGGLDLLIKNIFEETDLRLDVLISMHVLAVSFGIRDPTIDVQVISSRTDEIYQFDPIDKNVVKFKFDDGSTVSADRDFLIESSSYFRALLCGSFKESSQEMVEIKNVSKRSFKCLLNLLQNQEKYTVPRPLHVRLSTLLDVIKLTDLYLLNDLNEWIVMCAENYYITTSNAVEIYTWAVNSKTNFLRIETVAFLLTNNMDHSVRCRSFAKIFSNGLSEQITMDIKHLFLSFKNCCTD